MLVTDNGSLIFADPFRKNGLAAIAAFALLASTAACQAQSVTFVDWSRTLEVFAWDFNSNRGFTDNDTQSGTPTPLIYDNTLTDDPGISTATPIMPVNASSEASISYVISPTALSGNGSALAELTFTTFPAPVARATAGFSLSLMSDTPLPFVISASTSGPGHVALSEDGDFGSLFLHEAAGQSGTSTLDLSGILPAGVPIQLEASVREVVGPDSPASATGDWSFTLTIAPVPVPAALPLFGSGLLCMIGIGRRRKSASQPSVNEEGGL